MGGYSSDTTTPAMRKSLHFTYSRIYTQNNYVTHITRWNCIIEEKMNPGLIYNHYSLSGAQWHGNDWWQLIFSHFCTILRLKYHLSAWPYCHFFPLWRRRSPFIAIITGRVQNLEPGMSCIWWTIKALSDESIELSLKCNQNSFSN